MKTSTPQPKEPTTTKDKAQILLEEIESSLDRFDKNMITLMEVYNSIKMRKFDNF